MKSIKKILIICIFLIVILNIKAFAAEELNIYSFETTNDNVFEFYENAVEVKKANKTQPITNTDIEEYLKLEGKKHTEEINLEKYNISKTDFDKIMSLVFLDPEVFYINGYTSYYNSNNIMVSVKLNYLMTLEEIQMYSQKIEEVVQDYLSNIDYSTMNDMDKIIYTYNYVCRTCVRTDFGVTENYSIDSIARLLVDNSGGDLAYTKSYMYLLNQINIECSLAASKEEEASIWNLVKYEGDYYHVNTWAGDYKGNKYDSFRYQFFLESDASYWAANEEHIGMEFEATNTQFDSTEHHIWHWVKNGTTMHFKDGFWYYIKEYERGIYLIKYSFETDRGTVVNNSLYETPPYHTSYDITANNAKIYISYKRNIYSINYDGSGLQILYTIPEENELITAIKCDEEKIYYQTNNLITGSPSSLGYDKKYYCVNPVEKILFAESDLKLKPNETYNLNVLYEPSKATDGKEIKKWKSSNENVATVENGVITAKEIGNATITAQIGNGQVATCEVSVVNDIVYTTLPITILSNKECFVMNKDTVISNTVITDNFPVLEIGYEVIVLNEAGIQKSETEKLGSKNVVQINDGTEVLKEYTVIVPGDTDGDGRARIFDAYEILRDSIITSSYDEIDTKIRDYNSDGKVRIFDAYEYLKESIL